MSELTLGSYLMIMLGGAFGTGARLFLSTLVACKIGESFPWGTMCVNIVGCFAIGIFGGLTGPDGLLMTSSLMRQVVMIGVFGGFTTFSSFSLQTLSLFSNGEFLYASMNITLSLFLCLLSTWLGEVITRFFKIASL